MRCCQVTLCSGQEPTAFQYVIIGIVVGTLAGIVLSHGLQGTRALLGSLLAFLVAQFASVVLGLAAARVTAFLLWLILQANSGRGQGWRMGRGFQDRTRRRIRRFIWWRQRIQWRGGDFGGGGASGDW